MFTQSTASTYSAFSNTATHNQASRNKSQEAPKRSFSDIVPEHTGQEQTPATTSLITPNIQTDDGIRSAVMMGQLDLQGTGAATVTPIAGGLPEGLQFTHAWGLDVTAHTAPTMTAQGLVYETIEDSRFELRAYYDTNSTEDSPVMYVLREDKMYGHDELYKIDVNKVNPSNASHEEMVALIGYIYRDDDLAASEASEALDMARTYMEFEGTGTSGNHNYASWLREVARRNIDYPNPANQAMGKAAESLLEYLKDYPRG